MDTPNQASSTELLNSWWQTKQFEGKEFCTMDEHGALTISPFKEKIISKLNHITGDAVIQNLQEKFQDLRKQLDELKSEWASSNDRIKLMGKLNRLADYVNNAHAIGNFAPILQDIELMEKDLQIIIDENYNKKEKLVQEAEQISKEQNNWKEVGQRLRAIGDEWKNIGFVDKKRNEALWEKLEQIKNAFFEHKRNHQEDISKELLQNLDLKIEIVEKAEQLANSENWKEATEQYKNLMDDWKKTGRTIHEKNELLWQRFTNARNVFFDRKKAHTDQIKVEQEANYQKKLILVEKAETIQNSTEWSITAQAFNDLTAEWKGIGSIPSEFGNSLWERFLAAKETFFSAKKEKAEAYKQMLEDNYNKKVALIEKAEAIKNSTQWRDSTEVMNQLFEDWKQIGHVGKEHSEQLWEQFLSARKHFFNRKDQDRERRKQQFERNKKLHLIQAKNELTALEEETKDEQLQIEEFSENLKNITEGPKSEELKAHQSKLIIELEQRIQHRNKTIANLKAQIQQLEANNNGEKSE